MGEAGCLPQGRCRGSGPVAGADTVPLLVPTAVEDWLRGMVAALAGVVDPEARLGMGMQDRSRADWGAPLRVGMDYSLGLRPLDYSL